MAIEDLYGCETNCALFQALTKAEDLKANRVARTQPYTPGAPNTLCWACKSDQKTQNALAELQRAVLTP